MNWFPLPIFPEGSLASSVVTTVWVGVVVFCVMNLRFGWVFSGLVVPGYLVPLMIVKPWAAAVVVVEAVLTFWTVLALTRLMPHFRIACAFFGRDRFMAMIIVSAVYRVLADTWLLPMLGEYLTTAHGIDFDYRNNLHSFGLIVICLAANQLWKTGIVRGAVPFAFNIAVTYILVRYVLMEFTNFSISNLSYLYEDIASSIYASPKAYIVLITTSILASRMNLLYGWDFNGIMIPALIALQWYEPLKVLTSFVEALVILGAAILALKLPLFKAITVEGARKLLLFFTISFLYKMAIGWGLLFAAPEVKVSDFYGFGYLLPTLMAIKMHQMGKVVHQLRITAQISVVSIVVANAIGFALTFLPSAVPQPKAAGTVPPPRQFDIANLERLTRRGFVDAHAAFDAGAARTAPRPDELYLFEQGLEVLVGRAGMPSPAAFERARIDLAAAGFRIDRVGERFLRISPTDPASGRPFFIFDFQAESDLVVECTRALDERDSFEAGLALFRDQSASALAVAGAEEGGGRGFGDYGAARTWLASFHQKVAGPGTVEVRAAKTDPESRLYIKRSLPDGLSLKKLEQHFGPFEVRWEPSPEANALREATRSGFCEFWLGRSAMIPGTPAITARELTVPIDGLIRSELHAFAPRATNLYRPPSRAELLHIDRHILRPLFGLRVEKLEDDLARIAHNAAFYGYAVQAYHRQGDFFVLLKESPAERHWGSVLVRVAGNSARGNAVSFEIPSRVEDRSLLSFAATQFKRAHADVLITAGTNTLTNVDGSTNLTSMSNRGSFLNLAHQAFLRERKGAAPAPVVIQCRAFLPAPGEQFPEADLIVAPYFENRSGTAIDAALAPVAGLLKADGIDTRSVAEDDESSPYAVGFNAQARYLDFTGDGTFAVLWLSPFLRENYRLQNENLPLLKILKAAEIGIANEPLGAVLKGRKFSQTAAVRRRIKDLLRAVRGRHDIRAMEQLATDFPEVRFEAVLDPPSRQLFLVCSDPDGSVRLVANLSRHAFERSHGAATGGIEPFVDSRAAWLEIQPETR